MQTKSLMAVVSTLMFAVSPVALTKPVARLQSIGENRKPVPLEYRLILKNPSVCAGEALEFQIEIHNISDHVVAIDPDGLLYQVSITGDREATGSVNDPMPGARAPEYTELKPGDVFRKNILYVGRPSFPSHTGFYHLFTTYARFNGTDSEHPTLYRGLVRSNEVIFEIKDCDVRP